jgi:hypothetical protein
MNHRLSKNVLPSIQTNIKKAGIMKPARSTPSPIVKSVNSQNHHILFFLYFTATGLAVYSSLLVVWSMQEQSPHERIPSGYLDSPIFTNSVSHKFPPRIVILAVSSDPQKGQNYQSLAPSILWNFVTTDELEALPTTRTGKNEYDSLKVEDQCIPQEKWQTYSFVSCNQVHELDMASSATLGNQENNQLLFLGQGWFRAAWKFQFWNFDNQTKDSLVLKTLRIEREFLDEYYELHRRDAVAMERLTWSPYVLNIYGYCGQSALNELAEFKPEIANLEKLDRAMRSMKAKTKEQKDRLLYMKLKLGLAVATGLSHIHSVSLIPGRNAKIAHYDINPRNIAIVEGGNPKLNDFNIAEFIYANGKNETCGFPSRLHEPWWRAPEEMYIPPNGEPNRLVTEKVDVYALGAVLFHILTTHSPRGKMKKDRMDQVRAEVAQGKPPILPPPFNTSKATGVVAFRQAMDLCFEANPMNRATSHDIVYILETAVRKYERGEHA